MSFHDVRFPEEIGQGSSGGPVFRTEVTKLDSGHEGRASMWSTARHRYDVSYGIRSMEDLAAVKEFFLARAGSLNSFRYKDWADFTTNPTNPSHTSTFGTRDQSCYPTVGDGSLTAFQLAKKYDNGGVVYLRSLTLPVQGTVSVWQNSTLKTEGSHYSIDYTTGELTMVTAPTAGHAMEWSGEFDVKIRFEDDTAGLAAVIDGYDLGNIRSIPLIEVLDADAAYANEYFHGGASEEVLTAPRTINSTAFLWTFDPSSSGLWVSLPNPAGYAPGGPHWIIKNVGTDTILVKNNSGTTLVTLSQNESCIVVLTLASDGTTKTWYTLGG